MQKEYIRLLMFFGSSASQNKIQFSQRDNEINILHGSFIIALTLRGGIKYS